MSPLALPSLPPQVWSRPGRHSKGLTGRQPGSWSVGQRDVGAWEGQPWAQSRPAQQERVPDGLLRELVDPVGTPMVVVGRAEVLVPLGDTGVGPSGKRLWDHFHL